MLRVDLRVGESISWVGLSGDHDRGEKLAIRANIVTAGPFPLSTYQRYLQLADSMSDRSGSLLGPLHTVREFLRLRGPLDLHALEAAIENVLNRHAALRSRIVSSVDGRVEQYIVDIGEIEASLEVAVSPSSRDATAGLSQWIAEDTVIPVPVDQPPLVRFVLHPISPEDHLLSIVAHHTIVDGMSMDILIRCLADSYSACRDGHSISSAPATFRYEDFLQATDEESVRRTALEYWIENLAGIRPPSLRGDYQRGRRVVRRARYVDGKIRNRS